MRRLLPRRSCTRYHFYPQGVTPDAGRCDTLWCAEYEYIPNIADVARSVPAAAADQSASRTGAARRALANNKAYERVSEFLSPDHFADPIHARVFAAISRRIEAGQLADAVTLKAEFEHSGVLDEVGGTGYLAQLLSAMVGIINAGEYGRAVYDAWIRRQLIDIGEPWSTMPSARCPNWMAPPRPKPPSRHYSIWRRKAAATAVSSPSRTP